MRRIAVLFSGEGGNLHNLIKTLHRKECLIVCALTNNPHAGGIAKARHADIPVVVLDHRHYASRDAFDAELVATLQPYKVDLVVLAGFMRILTPLFTSSFQALNIHPSLLPRFKGARAIERSFEAQEPYAGATVHLVNDELDGGTIIMQQSFQCDNTDSLEQFRCKIRAIEYEILPKAIIDMLNSLK